MAQSKKRRQSVSPERDQQPQERKKRKINNAAPSQGSVAGPSRPRVERSPVPLPSDSSATLDGDSTSSSEKGKGKGKEVEKDPIMLELEQLRKEVAAKNELLENNKKMAASLLQALSCHVCLETMCVPYALSCGHMACQTCLVSWFTSTKNHNHIDAEDGDIDWYSDEESDAEADGPNPEAGPVANEIHAIVVNGHGNGNGDVPQAAPAAPVLNALNRLKTCPHCRCVIRKRPIQIYPVKDIIGILVPGVEQESQASPKKDSKDPAAADPWKGIFPAARKHNDKDSDDDAPGPGPGFGGIPNIPHPEPLHPAPHPELFLNPPQPGVLLHAPPPPHPEFIPDENFDDFVPIGHFAPLPPPPHPPLPLPPPSPPPPLVDEEDGVRRCGVCLHEIWDGACTNDRCRVVYADDYSEESSDDGADVLRDGDVFYPGLEGGHQGHHSDAVDGDVEDGYESSFIDDGDDHQVTCRTLQHRRDLQGRFWSRIQDDSSSDVEDAGDDDFIPGPSRRYSRGRQDLTVILSSSEEEGNDIHLPCRARRGRTMGFIEVDDDEDDDAEEEEREVEGNVRSADERTFASNDFVSEHQLVERSRVHYVEEDDEYYGNEEVPYVWDEDAEDNEGQDSDNVVYLDDEDGGEGYES